MSLKIKKSKWSVGEEKIGVNKMDLQLRGIYNLMMNELLRLQIIKIIEDDNQKQ